MSKRAVAKDGSGLMHTKQCHCCDGTGLEPDVQFGRDMRKKRLAAGISQKSMALAIGVSPSMLVFLEAGKRRWLTGYVDLYEEKLKKALQM